MHQPDAAISKGAAITIATLLVTGFALSLAVFSPGYMTVGAEWVATAALTALGDWQSPIMTVIWRAIDPIAPGSGSMLLLMLTLYWGGFALIAFTTARVAGWLGIVTMLLASTPPALFFAGLIW